MKAKPETLFTEQERQAREKMEKDRAVVLERFGNAYFCTSPGKSPEFHIYRIDTLGEGETLEAAWADARWRIGDGSG